LTVREGFVTSLALKSQNPSLLPGTLNFTGKGQFADLFYWDRIVTMHSIPTGNYWNGQSSKQSPLNCVSRKRRLMAIPNVKDKKTDANLGLAANWGHVEKFLVSPASCFHACRSLRQGRV
jgi:hypothetical protein